jgi:maltose/moltooligosaccharide transporter
MKQRPELSFWQIWNMCFGFFGIQFGFALQNANISRIFQTLGADIDQIPMLWIAAPLTGLIVQPIVGYCSDRTWTRLGRRKPYFLFGAIVSSLALLIMPNSPTLWIAAGLLWILDASVNVSMEPFRAYVGDQLPSHQRANGYAMQTFFIGVASVVASLLPYLLAKAGVANTAAPGVVPDTVKYAFYGGGAMFFLAVGWTVLRSREYPPEVQRSFDPAPNTSRTAAEGELGAGPRTWRDGWLWSAAGVIGLAAVYFGEFNKQLYVLVTGLLAYGVALLIVSRSRRRNMFTTIMSDLHDMPEPMRRLAVVQFFSWFTMFTMWIYTTPAVTSVHFGSTDPQSALYNEGANWVGFLFGTFNGVAAVAAIMIPVMVRRLGMRVSHLVNLWLGAAGLGAFLLIKDPQWLLLGMVGVGFAWASILSLPYALLADSVPSEKMGVYMGIFNFFIVIPQLLAASVLGVLINSLFGGEPIYALAIGGVSWLIAGLCVLRVEDSLQTDASALAVSK